MTPAIIRCDKHRAEYQAWLTAPYLDGERTEYTVTDNREDLTKLNHERWKRRIQTQLRLVAEACINRKGCAP